MPKRSSKKPPADPNRAAFNAVAAIAERTEKDPAAVELGRRGGLKGGKARAASLTPERRSEIAKAGAAKKWANRSK
jgi:hypothetical protein